MTLNNSHEIPANLAKPIDLDGIVIAEIEAARERGISIKAIAADAGISRSRAYAIAEGYSQLWLAESPRLMRTLGSTRIAEELARTVGGVMFLVRPLVATGHADIYAAFAKAVEELGDVARTKGERLADGRLDADDAMAIGQQIDETIAALAAMRDVVVRKAMVTR